MATSMSRSNSNGPVRKNKANPSDSSKKPKAVSPILRAEIQTLTGFCCRFRYQTTPRGDEKARPSSQFAQVYGHFSPSAHFLLTLQRFHLGPRQTGLSVPNLRLCCPQALSRVHHDKVFGCQNEGNRRCKYFLLWSDFTAKNTYFYN